MDNFRTDGDTLETAIGVFAFCCVEDTYTLFLNEEGIYSGRLNDDMSIRLRVIREGEPSDDVSFTRLFEGERN